MGGVGWPHVLEPCPLSSLPLDVLTACLCPGGWGEGRSWISALQGGVPLSGGDEQQLLPSSFQQRPAHAGLCLGAEVSRAPSLGQSPAPRAQPQK